MELLNEIRVKTCDCYSNYFDGMVKLTIDNFKKLQLMVLKCHVTDF